MSKKYKLIISEPWDFIGPDGNNVILGKITKEITPYCAIFESTSPIELDNIKSSRFVLFTRYQGDQIEDARRKGVSYVNIGILLSEGIEFSPMNLEKNSKFAFIGSIELDV